MAFGNDINPRIVETPPAAAVRERRAVWFGVLAVLVTMNATVEHTASYCFHLHTTIACVHQMQYNSLQTWSYPTNLAAITIQYYVYYFYYTPGTITACTRGKV